MFSKFKSAFIVLAVLFAAFLAGCDTAPPEVNLAAAKQKAEQCVEPTEDMRRNHMVYLDVHRDATMIDGVRTKKHSLVECINCHVAATREDGSPIHYENKDHFCASCHTYSGVKIDCFQCHADRPEVMEQPNYQHSVGSVESYHMKAGVVASKAPTPAELLLITGTEGAAK